MLWFKRNLFFVLSMVVGLGLAGWAGYDFYSVTDKNSEVAKTLKDNREQLKTLKSKSPVPTAENIQAAKEEEKRVGQFLAQFRTAFAPFPTPPKTDEKGFKTILETTIEQLRQQATNAEVTLQPNYYFSFSAQMEKLSYHVESIESWLAQMEEIKVICDILFRARITALDSIQRVPVSDDDQGASDYLIGANSLTNQLGVLTPYKITFRGYSEQIADVLEGFARSRHCWIVKDVDVRPSMVSPPMVIPPDLSQPAPAPQMFMRPQPMYNDPRMELRNRMREGGGAGGRIPGGGFPGERPIYRPQMMPQPQFLPQPQVPAAPVTVLSPKILFITLSVDLVKLKPPDVETNKPAARPAVNPRGPRVAPATP
jgi:hypothetical protein